MAYWFSYLCFEIYALEVRQPAWSAYGWTMKIDEERMELTYFRKYSIILRTSSWPLTKNGVCARG